MIYNFLFHRVNPERDLLWDPMDVKLFDKCIKYISENFEVELFEDLFQKESYLNSQGKIATIMFDDGYKDNFIYALPILEKYNCKASFYVVTNCIEENIPTWTHILEHIFQTTNISNVEFNFNFLPKFLSEFSIKTKKERIHFATKLKPALKNVTHEQRTLVMNYIQNSFYDVEIPKIMMSWEDLRSLKNKGHYIGSHTQTHAMLGTINDISVIKSELVKSRDKIYEKLGHLPKSISYPVGSFNEMSIKISKEVGYQIGLAVKQNTHNPLSENIFEVSRIELYNEPWWKTRLRISNKLEIIKKIIKYR